MINVEIKNFEKTHQESYTIPRQYMTSDIEDTFDIEIYTAEKIVQGESQEYRAKIYRALAKMDEEEIAFDSENLNAAIGRVQYELMQKYRQKILDRVDYIDYRPSGTSKDRKMFIDPEYETSN